MQTHPQDTASKAPSNSPTRGEKEVFLNQRVSAYRFHESLNLGRRYFDDLFDRVMIAAVSYRWNYLGEINGQSY